MKLDRLMKEIPTFEETKRMYEVLTKAGHGIYSLTKLERIIYEHTPKHPLKAFQFRFQLKKVLAEGAKQPSAHKRLDAFCKRYFTGSVKDNVSAMEILDDAVTEWNKDVADKTTTFH